MQTAHVIGKCTSTIKHTSLKGWPLRIVQPLNTMNMPDGLPLIAIDSLGCRVGDRVLISSDGKAARELIGAMNTPARWFILGLTDS